MWAMILIAVVLVGWNFMQARHPDVTRKVACVGDSLTYGAGVEEREKNCYPVVLQEELGTEKYQVGNFGVNGAVLQKKGTKPYWKEERYEQSISFQPDIVVLMLGTNDTKKENWKSGEDFKKDYEAMVGEYEKIKSKPGILLLTPPALFQKDQTEQGIKAEVDTVILEEREIIQKIGEEKKLPVIDVYSLTASHPEWYNTDGIHLNKQGAYAVAQAVRAQLEQEEQKIMHDEE